MPASRPRSTHISGILLLVIGLTICSGCAQTAEEKLVGRWYCEEMTIRFREDQGLVWNSPRGLAIGRYEFNGDNSSLIDGTATPNLLIDVIRNDERQQFEFAVQFLGHDRLRISRVTGQANSSQGLVMRRATDSILGGASQPVAQSRL